MSDPIEKLKQRIADNKRAAALCPPGMSIIIYLDEYEWAEILDHPAVRYITHIAVNPEQVAAIRYEGVTVRRAAAS